MCTPKRLLEGQDAMDVETKPLALFDTPMQLHADAKQIIESVDMKDFYCFCI